MALTTHVTRVTNSTHTGVPRENGLISPLVCARNRRATVGRVRSVQPAAIRDDGQVTKLYPQVGVVEDQDAWDFTDCRGEVGLRAWETLENRP